MEKNKEIAWSYLKSIGINSYEELRQALKEIDIPIGMFTEKIN